MEIAAAPLSDYLMAFGMTVLLIVVVVAMHTEALRLIARLPSRRMGINVGLSAMIICIIVAHCLEAFVFGLGYLISDRLLHIGSLGGNGTLDPFHFLYFSLETYTTQSPGDIYARGPIRLIAAIEPLAGLILIGWSTSFTFIIMRRDWRDRNTAPAPNNSDDFS